MGKVEYFSNNSGGNDWLDDSQWQKLRDGGWKTYGFSETDTRMKYASKEFSTIREAIEEWESLTGEDARDLGCSCCGPPHQFEFENDNGDFEFYSPNYPTYGEYDW